MKWISRILEILVVTAVVVLAFVNFRLRREIDDLRQALTEARRAVAGKAFTTGEAFAGVGLIAPSGLEIVSDQSMPKETHLVVIVNPDCRRCEAAARDVSHAGKDAPIPSIVISTGEAQRTAEFVHAFGLQGRVFRVAPATSPTVRQKLAATPQILLISNRRVVHSCSSVSECFALAANRSAAIVASRPLTSPVH